MKIFFPNRFRAIKVVFSAALLISLFFRQPASAAEGDRDLKALGLVKTYCFECHGEVDEPKGDFSLAKFSSGAEVHAAQEIWEEAWKALDTRDMPPREKTQPTDEERKFLMDWIRATLTGNARAGEESPGHPMIRRLNRLEYNNSVRDLFELEADVFSLPERLPIRKEYFHPELGKMPEAMVIRRYEYGAKFGSFLGQAGLPGDSRGDGGFNNQGDVLSLSPMLFEKYLAVSTELVNHPQLNTASPVARRLFIAPALTTPSHFVALILLWCSAWVVGKRFLVLRWTILFAVSLTLLQGVRMFQNPDWTFDFELLAWTFTTIAFAELASSRRCQLAAVNGTPETTGGSAPVCGNSVRRIVGWSAVVIGSVAIDIARGPLAAALALCLVALAVLTAPDRAKRSIWACLTCAFIVVGVASLWMLKTGEYTSQVVRPWLSQAWRAVRLQISGQRDWEVGPWISALLAVTSVVVVLAARRGRSTRGVTLGWAGLVGSLSVLAIFFSDDAVRFIRPLNQPVQASSVLRGVATRRLSWFLPRVFRKPVAPEQIERYLALYERAEKDGLPFTDAMKTVATAALCSPEFICRAEIPEDSDRPVRELNDYELATRMSYFLWTTTPDAELLEAARNGRLHTDAEMTTQTRRMLKQKKIRELSENFGMQWLKMHRIFSSRPDADKFPLYYERGEADSRDTAAVHMLVETVVFFEAVLVEDRSILDFVDADYAFLNSRMAKLYGLEQEFAERESAAKGETLDGRTSDGKNLPIKSEDVWRRIHLKDKRRGGVVTMAGPLAITAFPLRTSPVKRGAWFLETIFNRPPEEPKMAAVFKTDPEGRTTTQTIRQRLEEHRADPACGACHNRIDPPGFALENFDPIGVWRTHDGDNPVDAGAEFADGRRFNGPAEFKNAIMEHQEEFVRGFIEQMLSFAIGRKLDFRDEAAVESISKAAAVRNYRMSDVVVEIIKSRPFRNIEN